MKAVYAIFSQKLGFGPFRDTDPRLIGIFDSLEEADLGITKYFGSSSISVMEHFQDNSVEFTKIIGDGKDVFRINLMALNINQLYS